MGDKPTGFQKPVRVLYLDDERTIGDTVRRYFSMNPGFEFHYTDNPHQAVSLALATDLDILVTDIHMPELSGYEVLELIRQKNELLPILVLTGMSIDPEAEIRCLQLGANYFLRKPLDLQLLEGAILALCREYARKKESQNKLSQTQRSLNLLMSILDNSSDFITITDLSQRYVVVNKAITDAMGHAGSLVGQHCDAVFSPKDAAEEEARNQTVLTTGEYLKYEATCAVCGTVRVLNVQKFPLRTQTGHIWAVCTIARDITEQKQLTREHEEYFQAIQHFRNAICITDKAGRILHINPAFEALYGYDEETAKGLTPKILNPGRQVYKEYGYDEPAYVELFSSMWKAILDPACGHWEGEVINKCRDGKLMWARLYITAIRTDSGEITGFIAAPIDITVQRERELHVRVECYRALSDLAEARDNDTGEHLKRISLYSRLIAQALRMPRKFLDDIELFSPLHDIGKVGIADSILLAPRKLTPEEFEIMKTHVTIGHEILKGRETLEMATEITRHHHEHWDGTGYPDGLTGEAIPLSARIVGLVDVYDALRSERPYKKPWPHDDAVEVIRTGAGTHFDPSLVALFLSMEDQFLTLSEKYACENTGCGDVQ